MIIGLTGGIGSGKSFVASIFEELGVPIYISDVRAKTLMHSDNYLKQAIIDLLGKEAYVEGVLNRTWIAQQVFSNKEKLTLLNALVHPVVAKDFLNWYREQAFSFVIQESAILFESGGHQKCDHIILVTAPEETRIERVITRDFSNKEAVIKRIQNQKPDTEKIPLVDFIIENLDRKNTRSQVLDVFETLMKL